LKKAHPSLRLWRAKEVNMEGKERVVFLSGRKVNLRPLDKEKDYLAYDDVAK